MCIVYTVHDNAARWYALNIWRTNETYNRRVLSCILFRYIHFLSRLKYVRKYVGIKCLHPLYNKQVYLVLTSVHYVWCNNIRPDNEQKNRAAATTTTRPREMIYVRFTPSPPFRNDALFENGFRSRISLLETTIKRSERW